MKNLRAVGLAMVCVTAFHSINAQQPTISKPGVTKTLNFTQLPQKLECKFPALQQLAAFRKQESVSLPVGDFEFTGQVIDKVQRSSGVLSMNIQSTNMPGAIFTVSVITDASNKQKLVGRIVNPKSDEVLVLTEENNRYFLVKQQRSMFMTE